MPQGAQPALVYVVDDDASVRKAIGRLLRADGFEVVEFAAPEELLRARGDGEPAWREPACVLLDITMPGLSGLQVQAVMNARGIDWPVIALSAKEDNSAREASRHLGARLFLHKPVDAQALLDAIAWVTGDRSGGAKP